MKPVIASIVFAVALTAHATSLPGFRVTPLGPTSGFCTSIAVDSHGTIFYTTQDGRIFRFGAPSSTPLASVTTVGVSNSGLLGMALMDDNTAVVHYTTPNQTYDVISRIDLTTGVEQQIHAFVCDIEVPSRGSPDEHHGGVPNIGADGSIVVGIGDYGGGLVAALPEWNGGKIFRIAPDGEVIQFALGMRNPFGLVWDSVTQRVIVADNGAKTGDALFALTQGANCGWPFSFGGQPPEPGIVSPVWFFPDTIAPTSMIQLNHANAQLRSGFLIGAYVTKGLWFVPDIDAKPFPPPINLFANETGPVIGVAQSAAGDIYVSTSDTIYKVEVPIRGDCNGDGVVNFDDVIALESELADAPEPATNAQNGAYRGSWGCDANGDGVIDSRDLDELIRMTGFRRRSVRSVH